MNYIGARTIYDAWQECRSLVLEEGTRIIDGEVSLREILNVVIEIEDPKIVNKATGVAFEGKGPDMELASWMKENFTKNMPIPELGNARSYGARLRDRNGLDQLDKVIAQLRKKPETKSATITTLEPETDVTYVPCVSLLDFKIRDCCLWLTVTCRALDINRKAYHNLIELARLGEEVRTACSLDRLKLHVHVISAHIYEKDVLDDI